MLDMTNRQIMTEKCEKMQRLVVSNHREYILAGIVQYSGIDCLRVFEEPSVNHRCEWTTIDTELSLFCLVIAWCSCLLQLSYNY